MCFDRVPVGLKRLEHLASLVGRPRLLQLRRALPSLYDLVQYIGSGRVPVRIHTSWAFHPDRRPRPVLHGAFAFLLASLLFPSPNAPVQTKVHADWELTPSAVEGGSFRLLFVTSTERDATSAAISHYDSYVQAAAAAGHPAIQAFSPWFKALASTAGISAIDHTGTTHTSAEPSVPIYWLDGEQVAADYADLYDGTWNSRNPRTGICIYPHIPHML